MGLVTVGGEDLGRGVQRGLDALGRRDGQQRLGHAGAEAGQDGARARHLAVCVGEQLLVLVEGDESYGPN
jgi:hypothetical protein